MLRLFRRKRPDAQPPERLHVQFVRRLPDGKVAFGLGADAPVIDTKELCFCGHCSLCRFADAMLNHLFSVYPKFREWTRDQPPEFWLNYRGHYQAIAAGILALLEARQPNSGKEGKECDLVLTG